MAPSRLLVIGAGRGGTTLLAACLNGHPMVQMSSERGGAPILINGSTSAPAALLRERLDAFHSDCEGQRAQVSAEVWGNKITTEQIMGLEEHNLLNHAAEDVISAFFERMADYAVVFILRDGRSCISSKMKRVGVPISQAAYRWRYSVRVLRSLRKLGRLTALVKFEALVTDPELALRRLCGKLDLPFDPAMLEQTNSEFMKPEYRSAGFDPAAAAPRDLPEAWTEYIRHDLEKTGYLKA